MLIWTRFYQKCPHNKGILDFYRTDVVFCIRLPDSTDTKLSAISLFHFPHCYCHHLEILRYHQLSILWSPASPIASIMMIRTMIKALDSGTVVMWNARKLNGSCWTERKTEYPTGFSMKPNTTRFHIKAPFCHTITASQFFDDDDFEDEEGK